MFSAKGNKTKA